MEKRFRDYDPKQRFLFPPSVEEFVPKGHLSHFVREVVLEELDLGEIERDYLESRGAPPYSPKMMTALLLYGFTQGVYSSRKLARACEERLDFLAVSAMNRPRFRAIADFRKRHIEALGELFVQVLQLCTKSGLVRLGHVAVDGTRIKANASKARNRTYESISEEEDKTRQLIREWMERAEAEDAKEDEEFGEEKRGDELPDWVSDKRERAKRLAEARKSLEQEAQERRKARKKAEEEGLKPKSKQKESKGVSPKKNYNFTDPDSGLMRTQAGFLQGYNCQVAVDSESYVIVSSYATRANNDLEELKSCVEQIEENLGKLPKELSADAGYASAENVRFLERHGIRCYIPFDAQGLTYADHKNRKSDEAKRMQRRLRRAGARSRFRLRKQTVEPIFGIIKAVRGFSTFLLRRIKLVDNEWRIVCAAHNLLRLYQHSTA